MTARDEQGSCFRVTAPSDTRPIAARGPIARAWANAYLLLAVTTLIWGGNAIASRVAVDNISPMALTSLRWVGVCLIFPLLFRRELVAHWPVIRAHSGQIVLMGALGFTVFNALMYVAGHHTSAINMGITQGAIPALVMIGAWVLYRTPLGPLQALGLASTMLGVILVATAGDLTAVVRLAFGYGDVLMIIAGCFYAGYTLALRKRPPLPGLVFFTCMAIVACLLSLVLFGWEIAAGQAQWPNLQGWLIVLYVMLGPSIASQLMFMRGVELIGPARAGLFVNLVPIWAALLGVLLIGEPFALYHAVALVLVLGGIFIAEQRRG
jgi:drug/metabolite transporter (DMT)-like permease